MTRQNLGVALEVFCPFFFSFLLEPIAMKVDIDRRHSTGDFDQLTVAVFWLMRPSHFPETWFLCTKLLSVKD